MTKKKSASWSLHNTSLSLFFLYVDLISLSAVIYTQYKEQLLINDYIITFLCYKISLLTVLTAFSVTIMF